MITKNIKSSTKLFFSSELKINMILVKKLLFTQLIEQVVRLTIDLKCGHIKIIGWLSIVTNLSL